MFDKKWIVPGLLIFGAFLVIISIWGPQGGFSPSRKEAPLAYLAEKTGQVTIVNNQMPAPVSAKLNLSFYARDILRTEENSDVLVQWANEGQFRLSEKSEILIDTLENGHPLVVVRAGEIVVEKFGRAPSFWIRKDGQLLSAVDFALADRKNLSKLKDPLPEKDNKSQITQFEIESMLNAKKSDFFKCYGQALQKNSAARGQVLISFTIERQGQTTQIEISKSEISDNNFNSCVMEVVARTQFKSFSGAAVTTVFPMRFE
ncbi:MAG: TonB family protein [Bdellovibrio sp.]|nr:TonB family protein [Bdellovibrio sp.]